MLEVQEMSKEQKKDPVAALDDDFRKKVEAARGYVGTAKVRYLATVSEVVKVAGLLVEKRRAVEVAEQGLSAGVSADVVAAFESLARASADLRSEEARFEASISEEIGKLRGAYRFAGIDDATLRDYLTRKRDPFAARWIKVVTDGYASVGMYRGNMTEDIDTPADFPEVVFDEATRAAFEDAQRAAASYVPGILSQMAALEAARGDLDAVERVILAAVHGSGGASNMVKAAEARASEALEAAISGQERRRVEMAEKAERLRQEAAELEEKYGAK